jgi:hypothetical protein
VEADAERGGRQKRQHFSPQLIRTFNDDYGRYRQQQQVTTVDIHQPAIDDEDEPMPQPPLSIRNDNYIERHPYDFNFPTQRDEVREHSAPSAFMSTTSLYANNNNSTTDNQRGHGQSLLQRGNSIGRKPPTRPPQPSGSMVSLSQQVRQMQEAANQLGSTTQGLRRQPSQQLRQMQEMANQLPPSTSQAHHRQPSQENISRKERERRSQQNVDPDIRTQMDYRRKALREDDE